MKDSICSDFVFFNCTTAFSTAFPEAEVTVPWTSRKLVSWVVFLRCEKAGSLVKSTSMQTAESALVFVVPPLFRFRIELECHTHAVFALKHNWFLHGAVPPRRGADDIVHGTRRNTKREFAP